MYNQYFIHIAITVISFTLFVITRKIFYTKKTDNFQAFNKKVFNKFGRKCDICRATTNLKVHHTFDKTNYPEKRFIVKLGRVLCHDHHNGKTRPKKAPSFHNWMGGTKVTCTLEDYNLYKKMIQQKLKFRTKKQYQDYLENKITDIDKFITVFRVVLVVVTVIIYFT